jgi:peptidoglycan/xylan/chitin deacetylase (PgdA/CDA1 family)
VSLLLTLVESERAGERAVVAYRRDRTALRRSALGAFNSHASVGARCLRRMLLAARIPPAALGAVRSLISSAHRRAKCDRFLLQYAFWRGVRRAVPDRETWRRFTATPVILMYHGIGASDEDASCFVVPRRRFRWQMAWLYWRGYRVIPLPELTAALADCRLAPARAVVLTFDDGYADNYHEALPILRRYGFSATFFLVSGSIGGAGSWSSDPDLFGRGMVTPHQVEALLAAGMDVGGHTVSHVSLTGVPAPEREREIHDSRSALERRFGRDVTTFAYPFGDYDTETADIVRRAGFRAACCSHSGRNDPATPLFELRRVEVRGTDSLLQFALMVWRATRRRMAVRRA